MFTSIRCPYSLRKCPSG